MEHSEPTPRKQNTNTKPKSGFQKLCGKIVSKWKIMTILIIVALFAFILFWMLHILLHKPSRIYDDDDDDFDLDFDIHHESSIFDNIKIMLKISPSANSENNTVQMDFVYVPSSSNSYDLDESSFYQFVNTKKYFTSLALKQEYIPFGNPEPYGLYFAWSPAPNKNITEQYQPFNNMNKGLAIVKGQIIWPQNSPKIGIDVKMWRESVFNLGDGGNIENCKYTGESTFKGIYKNSVGYSYNVAEKIGAFVQRNSTQKFNNSWNITSGGYDNGEFVKYTKAIPGVEYTFSNVPIEIHAFVDQSMRKTPAEKPKTTPSSFSIWLLLMWISFAIFVILLLILIIAVIVYLITESKQNEENKRLINPNRNDGRNSTAY